jgi:hypothetical protein
LSDIVHIGANLQMDVIAALLHPQRGIWRTESKGGMVARGCLIKLRIGYNSLRNANKAIPVKQITRSIPDEEGPRFLVHGQATRLFLVKMHP